MTRLDIFHRSLKKTGRYIERVFWHLGTSVSGHCRCGEVAVVMKSK